MSAIHLWEEAGVEDFHSFKISLLAGSTPSSSECCPDAEDEDPQHPNANQISWTRSLLVWGRTKRHGTVYFLLSNIDHILMKQKDRIRATWVQNNALQFKLLDRKSGRREKKSFHLVSLIDGSISEHRGVLHLGSSPENLYTYCFVPHLLCKLAQGFDWNPCGQQ